MSFETGEWSLAKDKELIDKIENRSAQFLAPLSEIPKTLEQLATESTQLNLLLQNVIGELNTLSEKRFIENRVAEAHDEKPPVSPEPEGKPATDEQLREAVRTGLKAFGLLPVEELDDDDDRETGYECFARDRPFSLIIGSKQWLEADPFEGVTPVDTVSLAGTPILEAMEELVLPSASTTADDVEEATEAEAWYQKERASISTQGDARPLDSDSESSVISSAPKKSTFPPPLTDLARPNKPRGLFDDDDDSGDDGDLFGVSRKPSISSVRGPRSSFSQPSQLPESRRESVSSPHQDTAPNEPKSPVSFLDELKKKTGQRSSGDQRDVRSPPTHSVSETREKIPSSVKPQKTQQPSAQKRESIFDSDSESDISAPKLNSPISVPEPTSKPRSQTSTSTQKTGAQPLSTGSELSRRVVATNELPKASSLLDTDSEEEAFPRDARKQSLPKLGSPLGGATQALPELPKKKSLFDDSDSDSDIFGPPKKPAQRIVGNQQAISKPILESEEPAQIVKPKEFKGVRVLPQILVKPRGKEVEKIPNSQTSNVTQPLPESEGSRVTSGNVLASVEKPQGSESKDEEVISRPRPGVKLPPTRPQLLPSKLPKLFGDSDSDDDLFGAPKAIQKPAPATSLPSGKRQESTEKNLPAVSAKATLLDDHQANPNSTKPKADISLKEIPGASKSKAPEATPVAPSFDPLNSTTPETVPNLQLKPPQRQSEDGEEKHKTDPTVEPTAVFGGVGSPASKRSNIFSSDSDSDEGLLGHSTAPSLPNKAVVGEAEVFDKKPAGDSLPKTLGTFDDKSEPLVEDAEQKSSLGERGEQPPSIPREEEPAKTMADKTSAVKKIGMGLPAGLLQGLKARQLQLGIAQPEAKRDEATTSGTKSIDAQSSNISQPRGDSGLSAMKSEHKDIVEIAKSRVKGPTGRRLPTRSSAAKKPDTVQSSKTEDVRTGDAEIENKAVAGGQPTAESSVPKDPETIKGASSTGVDPPSSTSTKPETPQDPLTDIAIAVKDPSPAEANEKDKSMSAAKPPPAAEGKKEKTVPANTSRPKSKSIFASDSSDEELFAPKAPPRRKSSAQESVANVRSNATSAIPVEDDPLSAIFSSATVEPEEKEAQPVAPKRAGKAAPQADKSQTEKPKAAAKVVPKSTSSKSLFSDSDDDDDDGVLFGSKKTKALPKSATTSSLGALREKPKMTQSKSASSNLFGSDSDSDDLFKKK